MQQAADPRPRMDVPVRDAAGREVDAVAAQRPSPVARRASLASATELARRARARRRSAQPKPRPRRSSVVHDAVPRARRRRRPGAESAKHQWKYWPPSMTIVWPVMKSAAGRAEEDDRADDVLGHLVALDRARRDRDVAQLLDHLGMRLDAVRHREAGRDAVDVDRVLAELLRERAREARRSRPCSSRSGGGTARRETACPDEMFTILPPPCSRITGTTARQVRNIDATLTSITWRHSSSGISVNGAHRERGVEAGVVDEDVDATVPLERLLDHPPTASSSATSTSGRRRRESPPLAARSRSATTIRAPSAREPVGDRVADPLRAARDDRDLAVERRITASGENDVGIEDPVLLRVDQRLDLREELLPARVGLRGARAAPRARRSSS